MQKIQRKKKLIMNYHFLAQRYILSSLYISYISFNKRFEFHGCLIDPSFTIAQKTPSCSRTFYLFDIEMYLCNSGISKLWYKVSKYSYIAQDNSELNRVFLCTEHNCVNYPLWACTLINVKYVSVSCPQCPSTFQNCR